MDVKRFFIHIRASESGGTKGDIVAELDKFQEILKRPLSKICYNVLPNKYTSAPRQLWIGYLHYACKKISSLWIVDKIVFKNKRGANKTFL